MIAAGIRERSSLDELENHLREHVEQLTREGKTDEEAFDAAVERIGPIDLLKSEFAKTEGFLGWLRRCTSTSTHRVLAVVWMTGYCWLLIWILATVVPVLLDPSQRQRLASNGLLVIALVILFAMCGIIGSVFLLKGSCWGRRTVRLAALLTAAACIMRIYFSIPEWLAGRLFLEREMLRCGAVALFSLVTFALLRSPQPQKSLPNPAGE
jgi:hypothetical protein